jgi:hypothetical protein
MTATLRGAKMELRVLRVSMGSPVEAIAKPLLSVSLSAAKDLDI